MVHDYKENKRNGLCQDRPIPQAIPGQGIQRPMSNDGKKKSKFVHVLPFIIAGILVIGALGVAFYMYRQYRTVKDDPQAASKQEESALVNKVSKLIQLPNETPTIATVQDKTKLKGQSFFNDAKNGDKLLVYTKAQKAILYRESENKIINVGPIVLGDSSTSSNSSTTTK